MKENIRSPIVVTVGHVDHGKTTLLDKIRGTTVTKSEPGELTQHVGASYVPIETIKKICGNLLEKFKIKLEIPGLLILDTPGHAAFISLRKRGGSVSDLAILVIDIFEGFKEQTDESLKLLKKFKVPFVVAVTKIDKIPGWFPNKNACFLDTFAKQREDVKEELDKRIYSIVSQLAERGFNSERFDRVENFTRQIAIAPVSGITGEGLPELLMILSGLAQNFLKDKLKLSDIGKGMVLEVKETKGLGTTLDVVLFDGRIKKGDYLVIGGKEAIVTKVRAIFEPKPLRELRIEKQFEPIEEIEASAGAKISAINLENVIAGSPFIVVKSESDIEEAKKIVQKDVEDIQFSKQIEGVIVKADTLGSLEAMVKLLTEENIPIRKAEVGNVLKQDLVELQTVKEEIYKVILIFNVKLDTDILDLAKSMNVKIFVNNVIYRLIEDYKNWCAEMKEAEIREKMEKIAHPVKVKVLKGCIFHAKDPCIVGVEVIAGLLKSGVRLKRLDGKYVGKVKEIQKEGRNVDNIRMGDKVAISMEEPTAGRTFDEGDILVSDLSENELKVLREIYDRLSEDEKSLLDSL
jgi:translation initiation factor 5B